MDLEVSPTNKLSGVLNAPPSKSHTHRAIIISGLGRGQVRINDPLISADTMATIDAMRAIGADIQQGKTHLDIRGNSGQIKVPSKPIDVENSGTTLRILTSIFSLCDKEVALTGDESIQQRPMGPLLEALEQVGVDTTSNDGKPPITVKGPMKGDLIKIRGDVSSQYISGLLIASPLRQTDTTIEITTPLKSQPYLDLTLDTMQAFGVRVRNEKYKRFVVRGGQFYSKSEYTIEGDYSGAAFILGASALTDSAVTVENLSEDSNQGDKYFLDVLKMLGAEVKSRDDSITVIGGKSLRGIDVDLSQTPDLLPITAVMCALAKGRSNLYNVEHARVKECDRISAMAEGLRLMGAKVEERKDGLIIEGTGKLEGAKIKTFGDHRIVMAFAVAGLKAEGKTQLNKAESVRISYPGFFDDMRKLGAKIND